MAAVGGREVCAVGIAAVIHARRQQVRDNRIVDDIAGRTAGGSEPQAVADGRKVWTFCAYTSEPVGLFGVDPSEVENLGYIWMCSTPEITRHSFEFLKGSRVILDALHREYPVLTNLVDARNTVHHKWLRWMGFSFLRTIEKWGARGVPFHEFARLKPLCASDLQD